MLYDNNIFSIGHTVGSDKNPSIKSRRPNELHCGFINVCFNPRSKGTGCVRALTTEVSIRVVTRLTVGLASKIISVVGPQLVNGTGIGSRAIWGSRL